LYSSLRGGAGGGATSVRRAFPAAPGETIRKGDVVTVFDNQVYKTVKQPFDALSKFSPDVFYTQSNEQSRAVHPIGGDGFVQIGTTDKRIRISRFQAGAGGIVEKASKYIRVEGVEGINLFTFQRLTGSTGVICYLEHNTDQWRMAVIRWSGDDGLELGASFRIVMNTVTPPQIESVTADSFVTVWHCTLATPYRIKARMASVGADLAISMPRDAMQIEIIPEISDKFAFVKLGEGRFALNYWVHAVGMTPPTFGIRMLLVQDGVMSLGEQTTLRPDLVAQTEMRALVMSPDYYVVMSKVGARLDLYGVSVLNNKPAVSSTLQVPVQDPFYDAVQVSPLRFALAFNNRQTGSITTNMYDRSGGVLKLLFDRQQLDTVKGAYNRFRFLSLGDSLYVLTFNSEADPNCDFTQALLLRMTGDMTGFEAVNAKEQLINVWDQGCGALWFHFCAFGAGGRFLASGGGRVKLFRCGWAPTRFISAGVGEFSLRSGDGNIVGRTYDAVALSNGYVAVAYRERDTWHGKLSVFEPFEGGYRPLVSHTFAYSHVDNLALVEVVPGKIALQYKRRINPTYDGKLTDNGELKVLIATVSSQGLTEKTTVSFDPETYRESRLFPLAGGRLLVIGLDYRINLFARIFAFQDNGSSSAFVPLTEPVILDYERIEFTAERLGENRFSATSYSTFLVEISPDGTIVVSDRMYGMYGDGDRRASMFEEDEGSATLIAADPSTHELQTLRYARLDKGLYPVGGRVPRGNKMLKLESDLYRMQGKAAFLYRSIWPNVASSQPGEPVQDRCLALLDTGEPTIGTKPNDRHYIFPSSPDAAPVFQPIDDHRAFCIVSDGRNNQLYAVAYIDEKHLSFGKPYVTPSGVAGSDGAGGQLIDVTMSGIAESAVPLQAGAVYYADKDGALTVDSRGRRVGRAISDRELWIEL